MMVTSTFIQNGFSEELITYQSHFKIPIWLYLIILYIYSQIESSWDYLLEEKRSYRTYRKLLGQKNQNLFLFMVEGGLEKPS